MISTSRSMSGKSIQWNRQRRLSASCSSGAVRRDHDCRRLVRRDRAELGDSHREVGEHFEQERLELVVRAVELVDQEHRAGTGADRLQQRPLDEEPASGAPPPAGRGRSRPTAARASRGAAARSSTCQRLRGVDPLVALEADQLRVEDPRSGLADLGLADTGFLEQQRPPHRECEEHGRREPSVGRYDSRVSALDVVDRSKGHGRIVWGGGRLRFSEQRDEGHSRDARTLDGGRPPGGDGDGRQDRALGAARSRRRARRFRARRGRRVGHRRLRRAGRVRGAGVLAGRAAAWTGSPTRRRSRSGFRAAGRCTSSSMRSTRSWSHRSPSIREERPIAIETAISGSEIGTKRLVSANDLLRGENGIVETTTARFSSTCSRRGRTCTSSGRRPRRGGRRHRSLPRLPRHRRDARAKFATRAVPERRRRRRRVAGPLPRRRRSTSAPRSACSRTTTSSTCRC